MTAKSSPKNNGKICVSVCAKTADELIEQIKRAEDLADVIEIRFDCLDEPSDEFISRQYEVAIPKLKKIVSNLKPILATMRPKGRHGGNTNLYFPEILEFWKDVFNSKIAEFVDLEEGFFSYFSAPKEFTEGLAQHSLIYSYHNFEGNIYDFEKFFSHFTEVKADIYKIAVQTNDITDSIPIWQLLKRAKSENKEIILIAMGESGKWTRILGLAHGAFMTYASLDSDKETAPGQVTAKDLIEVYRAKELDENTDVYGILGSNTSVSMSPYIHNLAFKCHNLNAVFIPLQVNNLDEFIRRMVKPETREVELNFKGFAVTIPHKQSIIKHLDYLDETAEKIGAVNTVKIVDGKLHGYNTDAQGFIEPLKQVYGDLQNTKVAILGAGGASKACVYALEQNGADVTVFNRAEIQNSKFKVQSFDEFDILVNSTPLGMRGKFEGETPVTAEQMKGVKLVYDLVYIPFQTAFLQEADKVDVPKIGGMAMLVAQALEQQKIWTGLDAPMKEISAEVLKRLR